MALQSHISRTMARFGCIVSICLLLFAVFVSPPMAPVAHADSGPAVVTVLAVQSQHTTTCHAAPACAAFVAPAEISVAALKQLQLLPFFTSDANRMIQSGPSTDTPPPRV